MIPYGVFGESLRFFFAEYLLMFDVFFWKVRFGVGGDQWGCST